MTIEYHLDEEDPTFKFNDDFNGITFEQWADELPSLDDLEVEEVSTDPYDDLDNILKLYFREMAQTPLLTHEQEIELGKKVKAGLNATLQLNKITKTQQEVGENDLARIRELEKLQKTGNEAQKHLVQANGRLVVSIAKRYLDRGLPFLI